MQPHDPFNQAAPFAACYECDPPIDRERAHLASRPSIARQTFKETTNGHAEECCDFKQHGRTDAVFAVLVFLHLLGAYPDSAGKLGPLYIRMDAHGGNLTPDIKISSMRHLARGRLR